MKTPNISLELRVMPIDSLTPAAYNPRRTLKKTDKAYRKLEQSIREFGLVEPLIWNQRTGHIVGGHMRFSILKAMGVAEVPVSVVNLTDSRERALNVMLNNQEAQGRYDPTKLSELLVELEELPELELTGFDPGDLPPLKLEPLEELEPLEKPDEVTITLETKRAVFEQFRSKLDDLVAEFGLVSHVNI